MSQIISGERVIPAAELKRRALCAAAGLREAGVRRGDPVALLLRNEPTFLEATLAVGNLGAYPVALNWHLAAKELSAILEDCGTAVLIAHTDLFARVADAVPLGVRVLLVEPPPELAALYNFPVGAGDKDPPRWDAWLAGFPPLADPVTDPAGTMTYTSGTTGMPKGVRRAQPTPAQAQVAACVIAASYGISDTAGDAVTLVAAPLYHAAPNTQAMSALRAGAAIVLQARFDPGEYLALIARWRVTHLYAPPILFHRLLQLPPAQRAAHDLSSLRFAVHAAAPCPPDVKRAMIEWWGPILHEFYGSTESRAVTLSTSEEWLARPGTVGRALPGAQIRILEPSGTPLPPGEIGEVACGYPDGASFTYHGDDAKRAALDRDGLIAMGDIGYLDEAGYLYLCDRASDMIISGGVNIYPAEIEAVLSHAPGVADCVVFGIPDAEYGEAVLAVVEPFPGILPDVEAMRGYLRERLSGYKLPRRIE